MAFDSKPQLFSGARGKITFGASDGTTKTVLAIITDVSVSVKEGLRPTYVVGEMNPISIEPLSIDVDCSIGRMIPVNALNATTNGTDAGTGDTKLSAPVANRQVSARDLGMEEQISQILQKDSVEIIIEDKITGKTLAKISHARFQGRQMSLNSGDLANERISYVGIYDGGYDGNSDGTKVGYEF